MEVKNGYFVLVSNMDDTPAETLDRYFGRMDIVLETTYSKPIHISVEFLNLATEP